MSEDSQALFYDTFNNQLCINDDVIYVNSNNQLEKGKLIGFEFQQNTKDFLNPAPIVVKAKIESRRTMPIIKNQTMSLEHKSHIFSVYCHPVDNIDSLFKYRIAKVALYEC